MTFTSLVFLAFLAVVWLLYFSARHRQQNIILLIASYVFYGWWDWRFLFLLIFTSVLDFVCGSLLARIDSSRGRKGVVALSIFGNLGVLGFFKYYNFFAESFVHVLTSVGMKADMPTLQVILPVGISFYTFQSMSYTIDVYRRRMEPTHSLVDYLVFVSFFPQLVAGPIMRARELLPQCQNPRSINSSKVLDGVWLILLGYLKKVVIADRLAPMVDSGFGAEGELFGNGNSWLFLYAFAFQIYGDFSGYTDIARGAGRIMGFNLARNFRAPYLVGDPSSFWRHWHITLSEWLRDYLYIPLGGSRGGSIKTLRNLMLTMLIGGLWHGAGVAYLAWGLYHGVLLVLHHLWRMVPLSKFSTHKFARYGYKVIAVVCFFHITCVGWLLFRAGSIKDGVTQQDVIRSYLAAMVQWPDSINSFAWPVFLLGGLSILLQWKHKMLDGFSGWSRGLQMTGICIILFLISSFGSFKESSFIYFQF